MDEQQSLYLLELSSKVTGPVLLHYVWWILWESKRRGLKKLYFLARDGYVLREIALLFCKRFHLDIECRYLYCSRASLRMPSYHLIGEEAFDLLLLGGYRVTPRSLLERACFNPEEQASILNEVSRLGFGWDSPLSKTAFRILTATLRSNQHYRDIVFAKSAAAYPAAIGYLRQEGLMDTPNVAIVDSGWTGSMQRSLRQLLDSAGFQGTLTGFYFGMFVQPRECVDGTYLTWYFGPSSAKGDKIRFCNNLFECMLSAPHGMTVSYYKHNGHYEPVFAPSPSEQQQKQIQCQIDGILASVLERLSNTDFSRMDEHAALTDTRKRLRRLMAHPSRRETAVYGAFIFCDDVTEGYQFPLASPDQLKNLRTYSIPARILRKVRKGRTVSAPCELFWPYGTCAYASMPARLWYWLNIYVWEWLRYTLK